MQAIIDKAIAHLENEFHKLQLGRANPALIEGLQIEVYGSLQPIKNSASINVMDAQTLSIQPWDKSILHDIARAINESGLGLNPQTGGENILLKFPQMTEEKRREITKIAKKLGEEAKVTIRNIRADEMKRIKKLEDDKEISEDQRKDMEADAQKLIDEANKKVETLTKNKEEEIMKV